MRRLIKSSSLEWCKRQGSGRSANSNSFYVRKANHSERMRKMFFERALAQEWLQQNANTSGEIPHAEMIAWYQNHLDEYEFPAKAHDLNRLTVKVNQKQPRNQAWNRLAAMGNDVLNGRSFAEVAKESSEGPYCLQWRSL